MAAIRALLTFRLTTAERHLVLAAMNTSDEEIKVLRTVSLRLPEGRNLNLCLDPERGMTSTHTFPAILHPDDRLAVTIPISVIHAELDPLFPSYSLAACFTDMTGVEYLGAVEVLPQDPYATTQ